MSDLTCSSCGSVVPFIALHMQDLYERHPRGACCINPDEDLSRYRFLKGTVEEAVRMHPDEALPLIKAGRPAWAPAPEPEMPAPAPVTVVTVPDPAPAPVEAAPTEPEHHDQGAV